MMVGKRKELLFQQLNLSGLDKWSDRSQVAAQALLAKYHDIFSLKPGEVGCTDLVKHEIRVVDDEPLKETFLRIPPDGGLSPCTCEENVRSWCYPP